MYKEQTNDRYGHVFGDEVILKISETLIALMNESIHAVRIGGDEFAVIFENIDPSAAMSICDQAIHLLASFHFESCLLYTSQQEIDSDGDINKQVGNMG